MPAPSTDDTAAQFSRQAEAYADSRTHAADEDLEILAGFAAPAAQDLCLDIATGPGHTAFRIAAAAGYVIGADIAPGMLATAARLARERGIDNAGFALTDVHALAFAPASFELVTCRIAPHHFADVAGATREVVRVLKPGGRFVVEDSLAPEEPDLAAFLDQLERRRDPTHVRSLTRAEWHQVVTTPA